MRRSRRRCLTSPTCRRRLGAAASRDCTGRFGFSSLSLSKSHLKSSLVRWTLWFPGSVWRVKSLWEVKMDVLSFSALKCQSRVLYQQRLRGNQRVERFRFVFDVVVLSRGVGFGFSPSRIGSLLASMCVDGISSILDLNFSLFLLSGSVEYTF